MIRGKSLLSLVAGAVLNDVGPVLSPRGLARIAAYAGKPALFNNWDEATSHVRGINACAFPDNPDSEWAKWARRAFEQRDEQPKPARVGQEPEDVRELGDLVLAGHGVPDRGHPVGVDDHDFAARLHGLIHHEQRQRGFARVARPRQEHDLALAG